MKFSVVLQQKQAIGQLFVEDVYIFRIISCNVIEESLFSETGVLNKTVLR